MKNALTDFNARNADENTIQAMFAEIAATVLSGGYFQVNESTRIYPMNGLDSNSLHSVIISFSCLIVGRIVFFIISARYLAKMLSKVVSYHLFTIFA